MNKVKMEKFHYENVEVKQKGGQKIVRKVSIKNGKGYKSVTHHAKGGKKKTIRKPIHKKHINMIQLGEFIPGLFSDCQCSKKTRKNKK